MAEAPSRERLLSLVLQARTGLAAVSRRTNASPSSADFTAVGLLARELDEVQRTITRVRAPADFDLAAVLRYLATTCTGDARVIRDLLIEAAATADVVCRDGRPGTEHSAP